jgi:lysophospholipase L1-like esterase
MEGRRFLRWRSSDVPVDVSDTAAAQQAVDRAVEAAGRIDVGAGAPEQAWPADLGRILGWQAVVSADPGAGYISPGAGHRGPFTALAARLNLTQLRPALLLIQGGHNDAGQPVARLSGTVRALVDRRDPKARTVAAINATPVTLRSATREPGPALPTQAPGLSRRPTLTAHPPGPGGGPP